MSKGKILALDYGKKRIGIASGDLNLKIAFPRGVIENKNFSYVLGEIKKIVTELNVQKIVIGFPFHMEEREKNTIQKDVKRFFDKLSEYFDVVLFDERLSSFEADNLMKDAEKTTREKKQYRDMYAAQIILQHFFDSIRK